MNWSRCYPTTLWRAEDSVEGIVTEGHIDGAFHGWDGKTLFLLTNGQIWQQAIYAYWYHYAYRPAVEIYDDGHVRQLRLAGHERSIRVNRIR
jgi:hypothetical protein